MMRYRYNAVANGLGTDHPIPDLLFVDDSHIPLDDPKAIEAIGRRRGTDMWGRQDRAVIGGDEGGWLAYTTDPYRHDLAWCVRFHPEHGRSVVLYRNIDASSVHTAWWGPPLLFRSGGYWWDGTTWFRPSQIWDVARERYVNRPAPAAVTVHAADLLQGGRDADPGRADMLDLQHVDADKPQRGRWLNDLALWASRRSPDARSLSMCVVRLAAPELTGEELIGVTEMAEIAGVAASTLRAYISRGENDVPLPQATVNGRNVWARVVAQEWAEQRNRSPESVDQVLSTQRAGASNAAGITELWNRFTASFFSLLWDSPGRRKRWALRWRTETAVREIAEDLGWEVAASLDRIIPTGPLAATIRHAVLDEIATGRQIRRAQPRPRARRCRLEVLRHPAAGRQDARLVRPPPPRHRRLHHRRDHRRSHRPLRHPPQDRREHHRNRPHPRQRTQPRHNRRLPRPNLRPGQGTIHHLSPLSPPAVPLLVIKPGIQGHVQALKPTPCRRSVPTIPFRSASDRDSQSRLGTSRVSPGRR